MNLNKICPDCRAEYYPHIEKCADCGAVLMLFEEYEKALEERKRIEEKALENMVVVRDGDLDWMNELRSVLIDAGIPSTVHSNTGCGKGCCGDKCKLMVSPEDLERARDAIEEYLMDLEPDLRIAREMFGKGKCPACGSPVGPDDRECKDCGLPLIIIEEE